MFPILIILRLYLAFTKVLFTDFFISFISCGDQLYKSWCYLESLILSSKVVLDIKLPSISLAKPTGLIKILHITSFTPKHLSPRLCPTSSGTAISDWVIDYFDRILVSLWAVTLHQPLLTSFYSIMNLLGLIPSRKQTMYLLVNLDRFFVTSMIS